MASLRKHTFHKSIYCFTILYLQKESLRKSIYCLISVLDRLFLDLEGKSDPDERNPAPGKPFSDPTLKFDRESCRLIHLAS